MVSRLIIFGGIVIFAVIFFVIPFGSPTETQPSLGVPAPGFEDVPEMIVQENQIEPVSMFCRIYPNVGSCR